MQGQLLLLLLLLLLKNQEHSFVVGSQAAPTTPKLLFVSQMDSGRSQTVALNLNFPQRTDSQGIESQCMYHNPTADVAHDS